MLTALSILSWLACVGCVAWAGEVRRESTVDRCFFMAVVFLVVAVLLQVQR